MLDICWMTWKQKFIVKWRIFFNRKIKNKRRWFIQFMIMKGNQTIMKMYVNKYGPQIIEICRNKNYNLDYKIQLIKQIADMC